MEFIAGMIGFFAFVTVIFVVIALFLPEWVGITGKKAEQIMKSQQDDSHLQAEGEDKKLTTKDLNS